MEGLHWADYLIFVLFLIISIGIGVYHAMTGGRQRTVTEFIMANRSLKVLPVSLSLSMSIVSSSTLLVFSGEAYANGTLFLVWVSVAFVIAALLIEQVIVVWLFPMQLTSVFEFCERRFKSKAARGTVSFFGIIGAIALMGITLFAAAIVMQAVANIPIKASIPVMAGVCTLYTALGGMKAVVWTDVFQAAVMFIGLIAVLIKALILVNHETYKHITHQWGRIVWSEWSFDPRVRHTSWGIFFGVFFLYIFWFGLNQAAIQRHSATSSIRESRLSVLSTIPFVLSVLIVSAVSGLYIFSYFVTLRCDPLASRSIRSPSQALPFFVRKVFSENHGFAGYLLSVFCSGALSTVSSSQSGCAANFWEDVFKPKLGSRITELSATIFNKFLVIAVGLLGMTVGLLCSITTGDLVQLMVSFTGVCGAPLVGTFLLGGISRKASWQGAVAGAWTAFAFLMWHLVGTSVNRVSSLSSPLPLGPISGCLGNTTDLLLPISNSSNTSLGAIPLPASRSPINDFYKISYMWYHPIGLAITCIVGMAVSYVARYFDQSLHEMEIEEECFINWKKVFTLKWDPHTDVTVQRETKVIPVGDKLTLDPEEERLTKS